MLYDVFICHASEDKADIARPLAERLRSHRLEVWYDEFTLTVGMSLRQAIDRGLAKSRYGIVIVSPNFFGKGWTEWELNGLVERHLSGSQTVLLPVWHQVTKEIVASYSHSLADIVAVKSTVGLDEVTRQLLRVLQPEESALVTARNFIVDRGCKPPVISDDWWLDVIESTGWQDNERWYFPVWRMTSDASTRGEKLAWTVMQHLWQQEAESRPITQLTHPDTVLKFIRARAGLLEVCNRMPELLLELAPQLAIQGCAGEIEGAIEAAYRSSVHEGKARRGRKDPSGTALTTNHLSPACDECFALRHPTFGDYEPASVACVFVLGGGHGLGPHTRAFPVMDYAVWFLSRNSTWLPRRHHAFLLQGMKEWAVWPWSEVNDSESDYRGEHSGALFSALWNSKKGRKRFTLTAQAAADLTERIELVRNTIHLPEPTAQLVERFLAEGFIESWFAAQSKRHRGGAEKRSARTRPKG